MERQIKKLSKDYQGSRGNSIKNEHLAPITKKKTCCPELNAFKYD